MIISYSREIFADNMSYVIWELLFIGWVLFTILKLNNGFPFYRHIMRYDYDEQHIFQYWRSFSP
jgi:hypothetical protein